MWTCEKCGRSFQKTNQSHSCGKSEPTIEAYIASQPESIRLLLSELHQAIGSSIPEAEHRMSWGMPTYWKGGNIIHFYGHAKHVGIHIGSDVLVHFQARLSAYKTGKGSVQFPYDKPIPYALIAEMARWSYETLQARH
ncbi:MAG: DUF1801 domain-containing protein [Sphaerochaeta sp.]|jgi:uncharacterized protein YdhG (YjbR/CyaY superfamily)|uniref:YdhG-like domain-containing protein n=1 Tax=bioreactor metagenome TaxID=1076179 RepID=A0A644XRD1_9ZZZZ|nr:MULTISPECIES: DUF1801 domain-containing protein [Sphaerochaeta]MDD2394779.1 DUF1801 domain-containing protein [Sphaerochaeta sp.]MDD4039068.1 DUF1801 domain-containing protein [Sphaerochaeta sp.]MDX9984666.1 DUF1801 domain-containing protein [Sphaerochaeta sp.]MEA5028714.1 DUF1801 domain-containing protein [Sphaerochaeta associata]MEA5107745.1 DUF1801 domain-containing protein [Sphaerochaeta associata]